MSRGADPAGRLAIATVAIVGLATVAWIWPPLPAAPLPLGRPASIAGREIGPDVAGARSATTPPLSTPIPSGVFVGPGGRHYLSTTAGPDAGAGADNFIAIDPTAQVEFSSNVNAGTVTAISLQTGTLLANLTLSLNPSVVATGPIAYDAAGHRVFVAVVPNSATAPHGYVLALNSSTLAVVGNLTTPAIPGYTPYYLVYDTVANALVVENASSDAVVGYNRTLALQYVVPTGCPSSFVPSMCWPTPLVDIAPLGEVFAPDGSATGLSLLAATGLPGPSYAPSTPGFREFTSVYDAATNSLWVSNFTGPGGLSSAQSQIDVFNASTGTLTTTLSGVTSLYPPFAGAALPSLHRVYFANLNATGNAPQIWAFNDSSMALVAQFNLTAVQVLPGGYAPGFVAEMLPWENATAAMLVTSGYGYGTDGVLLAHAGPPELSVLRIFPTLPLWQQQGALDPVNHLWAVTQVFPFRLAAFDSITLAPRWSVPLSAQPFAWNSSAGPVGLVADPAGGHLFLSAPLQSTVEEFRESDGGWVQNLSFPAGWRPGALAVDSVNHWLYVADSNGTGIQWFNLTGGQVLVSGTILSLPGGRPACRLAADGAARLAWVLVCGRPLSYLAGSILPLYPVTGFLGGSTAVGAGVVDFALNSSGSVFVPDPLGSNLSILDPRTGFWSSIPTPGIAPTSITADRLHNRIYMASATSLSLAIVDASTHTYWGSLRLPSIPDPSDGLVSDPSTGTVFSDGYYSDQRFAVTEIGLPSAPTGLALTPGNGTLLVRWSAAFAPIGGNVTNYTVSYSLTPLGPWTDEPPVAGLSLMLAGLTNGQTYHVEVSASNVAGAGPPSFPAQGIPVAVPYPPGSVSATATASDRIVVLWTPPMNDGGVNVTAYSVQYATSGNGPWRTATVVGSPTTLRDLSPSTLYFVRVAAVNPIGTGNPGVTVQATTLGGPGPPSATPVWIWIAAGVGAAAVAGATAFVVVRHRRGRGGGAAVAPPPGASGGVGAPEGAPDRALPPDSGR